MSVRPEVWRKFKREMNSLGPPNISSNVDMSWGTKLDLFVS